MKYPSIFCGSIFEIAYSYFDLLAPTFVGVRQVRLHVLHG